MSKYKNNPNYVFDQMSRRWMRRNSPYAIPVDPQLLEKADNVQGANVTKEHFSGDGTLHVGDYKMSRRLDEPMEPIDVEGENIIHTLHIDDRFNHDSIDRIMNNVNILGKMECVGNGYFENINMDKGASLHSTRSSIINVKTVGDILLNVNESEMIDVDIECEENVNVNATDTYYINNMSIVGRKNSRLHFNNCDAMKDMSIEVGRNSHVNVSNCNIRDYELNSGNNSSIMLNNVKVEGGEMKIPDNSIVTIDMEGKTYSTIKDMSFVSKPTSSSYGNVYVTTNESTYTFPVGKAN